MLLSRGNIIWVTICLAILTFHYAARHLSSAFAPPASSGKPLWIRAGLYAEYYSHLAIFGAFVTAIRNRVAGLRRPTYSDYGTMTLSINESTGTTGSETTCADSSDWLGAAVVSCEYLIYLLIWATVYFG